MGHARVFASNYVAQKLSALHSITRSAVVSFLTQVLLLMVEPKQQFLIIISRTIRIQRFPANTGVPKRISKNIAITYGAWKIFIPKIFHCLVVK